MTTQYLLNDLYAEKGVDNLVRAEFESKKRSDYYRGLPTDVLLLRAIEHAVGIELPTSGHGSDLRPRPTDLHRGSSPPSARDSARFGPSSVHLRHTTALSE